MEQVLNVLNLQVLPPNLNDCSFHKVLESLSVGAGRFW